MQFFLFEKAQQCNAEETKHNQSTTLIKHKINKSSTTTTTENKNCKESKILNANDFHCLHSVQSIQHSNKSDKTNVVKV